MLDNGLDGVKAGEREFATLLFFRVIYFIKKFPDKFKETCILVTAGAFATFRGKGVGRKKWQPN
jgi:hypothetical protein